MAGKKPLSPVKLAEQREAIVRAYISERDQIAAARVVGVSQSTVSRVIGSAWGKKRIEELASDPGIAEFAKKCLTVASLYLDSVEADGRDAQKMAGLSPQQKATIAAILVDKYKILQPKQDSGGSSTQWQVNVSFPGIKSISGASAPLAQVNVATIEHNSGNLETKTEGSGDGLVGKS